MIERIEPGTPVIAAPWNDGRLPAPEYGQHRWGHRDDRGLGVTLCGVRQEDRGNGWVLTDLASARWRNLPMCPECAALTLLSPRTGTSGAVGSARNLGTASPGAGR